MKETLLFSNRSLLQLFYPIVLEQLLIILRDLRIPSWWPPWEKRLCQASP